MTTTTITGIGLRKTSLIAGILYLLTFASIPTLSLYTAIHKPDYISGTGSDTAVIVGGILEIIVALSGIGTAVVVYPLLKKYSNVAALGLVASRILEAASILTGVAFLFAVVTLHTIASGPDTLPVSQALVILYDRIFLLGQSFLPAVNDLLLGYLLYKSRLVPRILSVLGMAGAIPLKAGYLAVMFGVIEQRSLPAGLSAMMVALFEFSLGIYLVVKGFRSISINKRNVNTHTS